MSNTVTLPLKTTFCKFCEMIPEQVQTMTQDQIDRALIVAGNCKTKEEVLEMRRFFFTKQKNNHIISEQYEAYFTEIFCLAAAYREKYPRSSYLDGIMPQPKRLDKTLKERIYGIILQSRENQR